MASDCQSGLTFAESAGAVSSLALLRITTVSFFKSSRLVAANIFPPLLHPISIALFGNGHGVQALRRVEIYVPKSVRAPELL
jgi:hypothetical protein